MLNTYHCPRTNTKYYALDGLSVLINSTDFDQNHLISFDQNHLTSFDQNYLTSFDQNQINNSQHTINIDLNNFEYYYKYKYFPIDKTFEHLYLRGIIDAHKLFEHNEQSDTLYLDTLFDSNNGSNNGSNNESNNGSNNGFANRYKIIFVNVLMFWLSCSITNPRIIQ
jgi:hypothetical protein